MFWLIDKPAGLSSFAAISAFKYEHQFKKVGHSGTLDPLATGLLLIATDEDTTLLQYVDAANKTYDVEMQLGATSETYDITGNVKPTNKPLPIPNQVKMAIASLVDKKTHNPPAYSAKKINGERAYSLARAGILLEPLSAVAISVFKVFNISQAGIDTYAFSIEVSAGTYIRSLVHELGEALKCGAVMTKLRRTHIAKLGLSQINTPIRFIDLTLLPLLKLGADLPWAALRRLVFGLTAEHNLPDGIYALTHEAETCGVIEIKNNIARTRKLLGSRLKLVEDKWK